MRLSVNAAGLKDEALFSNVAHHTNLSCHRTARERSEICGFIVLNSLCMHATPTRSTLNYGCLRVPDMQQCS